MFAVMSGTIMLHIMFELFGLVRSAKPRKTAILKNWLGYRSEAKMELIEKKKIGAETLVVLSVSRISSCGCYW
jgi:hypothetical protein